MERGRLTLIRQAATSERFCLEARYHGWALFFGLCMGAVGAYVLNLTVHRAPPDRLGVALGVIGVLIGARFILGALTGRIPKWMVTFIDAEK
jgi:hypothetical protein